MKVKCTQTVSCQFTPGKVYEVFYFDSGTGMACCVDDEGVDSMLWGYEYEVVE